MLLSLEILKEVLEYLQDDLISLMSCLLVNRQWSQVAVEVIWKDPWKFQYRCGNKNAKLEILSMLISFLPKESRDILKERDIIIPQIDSPPMYDYVGLCQFLEFSNVHEMVKIISTSFKCDSTDSLNNSNSRSSTLICDSEAYTIYLIKQEIYKLFINGCPKLKYLSFHDVDAPLPFFEGAENCFLNLYELHCDTKLLPGTLYRMAQICQNLERLIVDECCYDNDGLATLIEVQKKLRYLKIITKGNDDPGNSRYNRYLRIAGAISTHAQTLTNFIIGGNFIKAIPPVTIATFENLQTLKITFQGKHEDILKYATFPQLRVLECDRVTSPLDILIGFIGRTGGFIEKISFDINAVSELSLIPLYNQTIARCCPKIHYLTTWFNYDDVTEFKQVLLACSELQHLIVGSYENEDEHYDANLDEFIITLEEIEKELVSESLNLSRYEFRFIWQARFTMLEKYLQKRKEKCQKPLSLYFSSSFISSLREDNDIFSKLEQFKNEGLIKDLEIGEYSEFK
ncbi:7611_t:CDS:1 [Gigaspora margarita]|uniref:7611_t:CDS:1 n=1 Tax=Gigaspora margarita TaxID=4874 RepID=A0ABM8W5P4_GIGMA|nr:7611_t:CDS:1 [Gigaspora margarita]